MNANEPAYPGVEDFKDSSGIVRKINQPGLTKRELFAAMAMQGIQASCTHEYPNAKSAAQKAVEAAEALLQELEDTE